MGLSLRFKFVLILDDYDEDNIFGIILEFFIFFIVVIVMNFLCLR